MNNQERYKVKQAIRYIEWLTALDPRDRDYIVKLLNDALYYS